MYRWETRPDSMHRKKQDEAACFVEYVTRSGSILTSLAACIMG